MSESGCTRPVSVRSLRTESLPFSSIPSQSKLFVQYQEDPLSLKRFFPSAVASHTEITGRVDDVLAAYTTDRSHLCDALESINSSFNASDETLANIEFLRENDSVAVLTGQQTGLFTGPLYSIYKALSAVKMAECLRVRGVKAMPVFWMATEDHDLAEVSNAFAIDSENKLFESRITSSEKDQDRPVGRVELNDSVVSVVEDLLEALPQTEFSTELRRQLMDTWKPGTDFGEAFGTLLTGLLGKFGIVIVDPLDKNLKKLVAPVYVDAIKKSEQIVSALGERSAVLTGEGYHAQVTVEDDYFPLFYHADDGRRTALRRKADGSLQVKGERKSFTENKLIDIAESEPERFSPGVMLRPVVQDFLFPTLCYFGGGAEIAYFAQNSEVYRLLDRPVTPIFHRQSFTIVEAKHARTLEKYNLDFADLLAGETDVLPRIIDEFIDRDTAKLFADVEEKIHTELTRLDRALSKMDVTLSANLATRRRKILYHIAAMRKKYYFRRAESDENLNRRLRAAFTSLLPQGHLQERSLNVVSFLDRFGPSFIEWIYESIDLDDKGHRILYL